MLSFFRLKGKCAFDKYQPVFLFQRRNLFTNHYNFSADDWQVDLQAAACHQKGGLL